MTADANQKLERCAYLCGERAWRLACMLTGNVTDAEDVLQQAFLVAASKVERLPKDDPWPWFAAVVTNVSRHHWRKHRRRTMEEPSVEIRDARANDPADEISGREMNERLKGAVASLPEQEREAVILTHVSGLSYSEAAKALDMPKATVALRVKDGLESLRGKLGSSEATVTTSLSALPLAMPAGGLDQALSAWVSAAQASVGVAGVGSAVTAAGVIGEAIMVKEAVLVAGAVLCVGIGAVSGVTVNNALSERSDRVPVAENTRTGGALNGGQDPAPEQDKRLTQTIPAGHTTIAVDEYNRLKEELSRSTTLLRERDETVARLNDAVERLEKSAVVETPSSPDEAKIRERATELADKVKQAIDAGDKPAVMKNMAELLKLGTVSYREFFDAYDTLLSKSNPYTTMNPLGLSQFEFFGLLPREFAELALRNPNNDIPVGSRCAALYIAPYTGVSDDAITDTYVAILANPNSHKWLLDAAIENARMAGNPKLVPALVQLTTNPLAPSNSRVKALATLILNSLPLVDTSELSPLAGDSDENVKRMYGIFLLAKTPPVNGFLIVECGLSSTNAGLLAGDIITRVAEAPATNLSSIDAAIAQLWLTSDFKATPTMTVEFYRDGEIKIISPPAPENIGVFDGYLQGIAVVNK